MLQRSLVVAAAWIEIVTGVALIAVPDVACRLLFTAAPEAVGALLGRLFGLALFALGVACMPPVEGPRRSAVRGLFAYNAGVAILAAWVGLTTALGGFLLWPAAVLHTAIAAGLLAQLLNKGSFVTKPAETRVNQTGATRV